MKLARRNVLGTICRLALATWFGVGLLALSVPAAEAASASSAPAASATTLPATNITPNSAVLNASIQTRGQATEWEFQYGVASDHAHSTPVMQIPAGRGTVNVSEQITGLTANTTYRFRVIAISGFGSHYVETYYAADRFFTTNRWHGSVRLDRKRLHVSRKVVAIRLTCASKRACHGHLSIVRGGTVVCAKKSFRIGAGATRTVRARVSTACMALLASAPQHRIRASFKSTTTTDQRGQDRSVKLIRG